MPDQKIWLNQHQPQTLLYATLLLYVNAAFRVLDVMRVGIDERVGQVWLVIALLSVGGGFGVANEKKWGYGAAIAAALAPFAERLYFGLPLLGNILSLAIEIALIGLVLHPQSRSYQKLWFK